MSGLSWRHTGRHISTDKRGTHGIPRAFNPFAYKRSIVLYCTKKGSFSRNFSHWIISDMFSATIEGGRRRLTLIESLPKPKHCVGLFCYPCQQTTSPLSQRDEYQAGRSWHLWVKERDGRCAVTESHVQLLKKSHKQCVLSVSVLVILGSGGIALLKNN